MTELHNNELTAFIVCGNIYKVVITTHAKKRLRFRNVDKYYVASACLALGEKLEGYNNSGKQIMICDTGKNISLLITVEDYKIVIITVLEKSDPYVKDETIVENFCLS